NPEFPGRRGFGTSENGSGNVELATLFVEFLQLFRHIDTDGAERDVNSAFRKRVEQSGIENVLEGMIVGQHREHGIETRSGGDVFTKGGALPGQRLRFGGGAVPDGN